MSKQEVSTEPRIAWKSQALEMRRQNLRQRRHALRKDALRYCARPSTLGVAAVSGFLLARIFPPLIKSGTPPQAGQPSRLLDPYLQMIPVLVFERLRLALMRRSYTDAKTIS